MVFFLEDDRDLGALFQRLAETNGYRAIWADSVDAMVQQAPEILKCALGFLDINLGQNQPSGLDAFEWLMKNNYSGRVFFLTGHGKEHPLVAKALACPNTEVLTKPFSSDALLAIIGGLEI